MIILGLSCFYHDSAACLLRDGEIIAATQEERFTRVKHDQSFPTQSIKYCLDKAGVDINDIEAIVFYDKPFLKFERILETYLAYAPQGIRSFIKAMQAWLKKKLWIPQVVQRETDYKGKILFAEHHLSHAASSFFSSPFQEAAFLTVDGVGEWATTSFGVGEDNKINTLLEIHFPHSLGLLYSAFTYYTGFRVNSGEYKLMGLAPYGEPKYVDVIYDNLIDIKEDGSFRLNMDYFNYPAGLKMTNKKFDELFGGSPRKSETEITQKEMDIARSIQVVTEELMLRIVNFVHKKTGKKYLCLAGGVALNCVSNGRILREGPFKDIWIQPASGDAGGALGAALYAWYHYFDGKRFVDDKNVSEQNGSYFGPEFSDESIRKYLDKSGIGYDYIENDNDLCKKTAELISEQKIIGWFQGRMEFGPRALGNRSILGDPRSSKTQKEMNLKIKYRESFRPFAPSVLEDKASDFFNIDRPSPYMLITTNIRDNKKVEISTEKEVVSGLDKLKTKRSVVPAITHVDYSARLQTVSKERNERYYELINSFYEITDCPLVVNTSFNVRGEPIVCTPEDAYKCFMRTEMDYLVMGNFVIDKENQKKLENDENWREKYELD